MEKIFVLTFIFLLAGCGQTANNTTETVNTATEATNMEPSPTNTKPQQSYNWSRENIGPYNDKISYTTGKDLLNWTDSQVILAEHASVPGAIIKGGVISLYFVDVSQDGLPEQIGLLRSEDNGKTWSDKLIVIIEGLADKVPVDPSPLILDDGRVRLYYYDINERPSPLNSVAENKIYSAISEDGLKFVQEEGVRFARKGIFDPDVNKYGDTWTMYTGAVEQNQVIYATSTDGLSFTEKGVAFEGGAVPDVFLKNKTYYLYTAGINIATSTDGAQFTATKNSFRSQVSPLTADPSVIELPDHSYMMFYKTKTDQPSEAKK